MAIFRDFLSKRYFVKISILGIDENVILGKFEKYLTSFMDGTCLRLLNRYHRFGLVHLDRTDCYFFVKKRGQFSTIFASLQPF